MNYGTMSYFLLSFTYSIKNHSNYLPRCQKRNKIYQKIKWNLKKRINLHCWNMLKNYTFDIYVSIRILAQKYVCCKKFFKLLDIAQFQIFHSWKRQIMYFKMKFIWKLYTNLLKFMDFNIISNHDIFYIYPYRMKSNCRRLTHFHYVIN